MRMFARVAIALLAGTATGAAGTVPHRSHTKAPDAVICRDVPMSGSRLDVKRVCMTRLQWEDMQREARQTIEKAQTQQINAGR